MLNFLTLNNNISQPLKNQLFNNLNPDSHECKTEEKIKKT